MSEQKLDLIFQTLQGMNKTIVKMDQRIDTIDQTIVKMDQRIDKMDQKVVKMDERIDKMDQKVVKMDEVLHSLESGQKELHQITSAIRENLDVTNAKLEALTMNVHHLHGDVTLLKEFVTELKNGQERQDKILEALAVRSLEQETDIRDLKRIK